MNYHVTATIQDESHALIEARGHRLTLNVKKGAGEAGFNAAETLLAALGACISPTSTPSARKCACKLTQPASSSTPSAATNRPR